jgi:threonine dehydrogenase-like Zn-dependent dehydrogenase
MITYPRILGHEVAATVVEGSKTNPALAAGVNVTMSPYTSCGKCASCRRGRPNACQYNQTLGVQRDGALTEYIAMPAEKLYPADLTIQELCLIEPLTVGAHAVSRGRVTAEDTVAVFGCGGVGLGAIAASHFRGARTIGIDIDEHKLLIAKKAGAAHTINTTTESLHERLGDLCQGQGPDVVIEAIGSPQTFRAAVEEVAFTGRVVYIGYAKEPVAYETRLFVQKELDIMGSRNALPEDFQQVIRMLQGGHFPVEDAVSAVVPLEESPGVLRAWSDNPASYSKIMVRADSSLVTRG